MTVFKGFLTITKKKSRICSHVYYHFFSQLQLLYKKVNLQIPIKCLNRQNSTLQSLTMTKSGVRSPDRLSGFPAQSD